MSQTNPTEVSEQTSGGRESGVAAVRRPTHVRLIAVVIVTAALVVIAVLSITFGSRGVGWSEIWGGLLGRADSIGEGAVLKRVHRTMLALALGAGLGVAGAVMQGVTRNPLADPGILGVNMGASLAVVIGIAWFGMTSPTSFIWVAILGAALTAVAVYGVASLGRGGATPLKLALAGAASAAALASLVTAVVLPRGDIAGNVRSWQIGSVGGANLETITQLAPFLLAGFVISMAASRSLNSLALGDDLAAGLGERVALARGLGALGAVLLAGACTALAGPIGFVGLVVPHLCRLLVGVDYRWLIPFSAMAGAGLLAAADIVGRVVARPAEVPVGIVTALIGAPVFIYIVRRQKMREL